MDMLSYFLGRLANGEGGGGNGPIYIGGVLYTNIEYKDNNTVILTEEGGTQHIIRCIYSEDKIQTLYYDEVEISLTYDDEGELIKIGDTVVDMSIAPTNSGGTEVIEQLIDESGVLDTEGTVTEKVEQLIDKAEDENMWYGHILANISNSTMFSRLFANYPYSQLPRVDLSGAVSFLYYFTNAKITSIDYYLDTPNLTNCNFAFQGAKSLKSIKGINTSKVTSAVNMFNGCVIETIEMPFNFSSVTNTTNAFWCSTLKNVKFVAGTIKVSIAFTSPILTTESIQSIIDGLATVTTAQTLTLNSAIVLTDEQKATIKSKGWTLVQ